MRGAGTYEPGSMVCLEVKQALAKARRAERLDVASRILAGIVSRRGNYDSRVAAPSALRQADFLIAEVDK